MIQIRQLKLMPGHSDRELTEKVARTLRIRPEEIASLRVVRQSIDARKKPEIRLIYTVDVKLVGAREEKVLLSCRKNPDVGPAPEVRYRFPEPGKEILYGRRRIELSVIEHEDARVQRLKDAARMKRTDKS